MKNGTKSCWWRSRTFKAWLVLFTLIVVAMGIAYFTTGAPKHPPYALMMLLFGVVGASVPIGFFFFARWLCRWRNVRRLLLGIACFATLIAIAYTEENWRGKRAWEKCKRELEAQGEVLDWNAYIPPPVPDDQNIFKAPKMQEWFVRPWTQTGFSNELSAKLDSIALSESVRRNDPKNAVLIAELSIMSTDIEATNNADLACVYDDPASRTRITKLIQDAIGPSADGAQGFTFVSRQLNQINPLKIILLTNKHINTSELSGLLPDSISAGVGKLRTEGDADAGSIRIMLASKPTISAREYLAWSDKFEPEFDLIRAALKRPYARMDGDYSKPYEIPMVNFVNVRNVAQTLAQRTQCYLLLGQPDKAIHELTLLRDICHLVEGQPCTLVATMINVAVTGLFTETVAEGFRLNSWRETDFAAIQLLISDRNLLTIIIRSFRTGRAAVCNTFESNFGQAARLSKESSKIFDPTHLFLRAWVYQNIATVARIDQEIIECIGTNAHTIDPDKVTEVFAQFQQSKNSWSPYKMLANIAIPNFSKAFLTFARNQTKANQAFIVCALERCHLAQGQYPETLDALIPQFADKLPTDIIGGQPLKYRRTDNGRFILYSVGWNEKDDGGKVIRKNDGSVDLYSSDGDWVWSQWAN